VQAGIPESQVEICVECTIEDKDNFYSYRREGDQSGRMLGLIQIKE
jgi:copper oxidase (laccase) domain-containing protein